MVSFGYDLGCHIGWSAAVSIYSLADPTFKTESEIYKFELLISIQQDVLCFDVSMYNIFMVEVLQSFGNGLEEQFSFGLLETMLWLWQ